MEGVWSCCETCLVPEPNVILNSVVVVEEEEEEEEQRIRGKVTKFLGLRTGLVNKEGDMWNDDSAADVAAIAAAVAIEGFALL